MRKTKIVCTLGPATDDKEILKKLMSAGMSVARINFSHGSYRDQEDRINLFKEAREEIGFPIPMLLDTQGPEIRIRNFEKGEAYLFNGEIFTLVCDKIVGDDTRVGITYEELYKEVEPGRTILINDGTIEIVVEEIVGIEIKCRVIHGGKLTNRKSVNIPDLKLSLPSITQKDIEDIKYGITAGFDYIAASFVRKPEDVIAIREVLEQNGGSHIKIISKIENREGVDNFTSILDVTDGIMIARGDLGVEIPIEEVPILQKRFIKEADRKARPVITATQMLESMISSPRPTRAEVSDVANAIYDASGSIMLSGETASGNFPVECVEVMNRIASTIEEAIHYWARFKKRDYNVSNFSHLFHMNYSVCLSAANIGAKAIVAYTNTGDTARILASFGPACPIYAITENEVTYRQLGLSWGVIPKLFEHQNSIDELITLGVGKLKQDGFLQEGDIILVAGGAKIVQSLQVGEDGINHIMGGIVRI
ncbi:MAG: pyruvate kinase [Oscillospiraceae bacterium]|nr:pyruvate kinase [Oscillospiraceae bacterium]